LTCDSLSFTKVEGGERGLTKELRKETIRLIRHLEIIYHQID